MLRAVLDDYAEVEGRVVLAREIRCVLGAWVEYVDLGTVAAVVRIDAGQGGALADGVARRAEEKWFDPLYPVTLLEPHPLLRRGASFSVEGRSRSLSGRAGQATDFVLADDETAARHAVPGPVPGACRTVASLRR